MERVVDIETDGLFLSVHRGFLTVSAAGAEQGRIALDDIGAVIVHAHGVTWSTTVFTRLSERAVPVVICGSNHAPVACVWPLDGHHLQAARMRAQIGASRPLGKQIWARIVAAKIRMQGDVLARRGIEAGGDPFHLTQIAQCVVVHRQGHSVKWLGSVARSRLVSGKFGAGPESRAGG